MSNARSIASELGKRGAKARAQKLTPEQRQAIARLGGLARWTKRPQAERAAWTGATLETKPAVEMRGWFSLPAVKGDVEEHIRKSWSPKIVRAYEEQLDAAMKAADRDGALRILMAMTAMSPLTPARLRQVADGAIGALPSYVDLSPPTTQDLARVTGRRLTPVGE